jgi:hypothetical protein
MEAVSRLESARKLGAGLVRTLTDSKLMLFLL